MKNQAETVQTRVEKIETFLSELNTDIDILNYVDIDNINSFDDIQEQIEDNRGFDAEVIYHHVALDYLRDNDPSLKESLSIASEMGFEVQNLNSETLASLLKSQNLRDEFYELQSEIESFFEDLED